MKYNVVDPDDFYNTRAEVSITFIYNPFKNRLFTDEYPESHGDMQEKTPELAYFSKGNNNLIKAGYLLGRLGMEKVENINEDDPDDLSYLHDDDEYVKAIVFWNTHFNKGELEKCLQALIKKFPLFEDPETLVAADKRGTYDRRGTFRDTNLENLIHVSNEPAQKYNPKQQRPECSATLDVKGIPTSLSDILGNFHMVKDDRLPAMKAAICSQGPALKAKLQKSGCDTEVAIIDQLLMKAQCQKSGEYDSLKQGGRIARKQELQKIFASPELMSRNFRTQKELDAAWDELQGKKEHRMIGFAEWISKYSQS